MQKSWIILVLLVALITLGIFLVSQAQTPKSQPVEPAKQIAPMDGKIPKVRDSASLTDGAQPIFHSAQRAMDWLKRTSKPDGRFVHGFQPNLCVTLDGDNFVSQVGAAFALARASRYFRDEAGTVKARQAILTLLLETMLEPGDKSIRRCAAPPLAVDRLSAHGYLISAIHELDNADKCPDLLKQSEELCNYLRRQQQPDGSLSVSDGANFVKRGSNATDMERAGWALQGVIRSQKHRPADWKIDMVRKARDRYLKAWKSDQTIAAVCNLTPAFAEAYVVTKDTAYRDAVYAMNDWLIELQYPEGGDAARNHWVGGFKRCRDGKIETITPDISSATPAESLAEACRVAKSDNDLVKFRQYERALLLNIRFLMTLQYSLKNTTHYVESFRPSLMGAFYASHQDGHLRIDYTRPALCGMVQYLEKVLE
jgi:hypothetical protein